MIRRAIADGVRAIAYGFTWAMVICAIAFLAGARCTPAFSAAMSSAPHRDDTGAASDLAAVRADMARTTRSHPDDRRPASEPPDSPILSTPRDDPAAVLTIIRAAAIEFGQDPDELVRVAFCESSHRPDAIGDAGASVGLFQFQVYRWNLNAPSLGYHDDLRLDPVASSRVAAYAFSTGQRSAWTCAR